MGLNPEDYTRRAPITVNLPLIWPRGELVNGEDPQLTQYPDGSFAVEQVTLDGGVMQTIFVGPFSGWWARNYLRAPTPGEPK